MVCIFLKFTIDRRTRTVIADIVGVYRLRLTDSLVKAGRIILYINHDTMKRVI